MLRFFNITIIFFVGVCSSMLSQTHNIVFEEFTADGVLEGKSIIEIVQDKDGFLWFGAVDGLYRYDGSRVKWFTYEEEDSTSLSDNYVRALFVDSEGTIWVGAWNNGLNKYDSSREAFVRYQHDPNDSGSLGDNNIEEITEDSEGRLWVVTGSAGLNLFDPDKESFQHVAGPQYFQSDSLWRMIEDQDQQLWVGHRDGVDVIDMNALERKTLPQAFQELRGKWVTALHEDPNGDIWFGTWRNGLYRWRRKEKDLSKVLDVQGNELLSIKDFFDGPEGKLWITAGKVCFFDYEKNELVKYQSAKNNNYKIENKTNWPIFQDREDVIWIGSWEGISMCNSVNNIFDYSYRQRFESAPFFNDPVRFIREDRKGNLWIVWKNALGYWDLKQQHIKYHDLENRVNFKDISLTISDLYTDKNGFVWIITQHGPFRFDLMKNEIVYLKDLYGYSSIPLNLGVFDIEEDTKGNLWMASLEKGLFFFDYEKKNLEIFQPMPGDTTSIGYSMVNDLYLESDSILWLATYGAGVERFDTRQKKVTHRFRHQGDHANSLSQDRVIAMIEDDYEQIWIGTEDGLNVLDKNTFQVIDLSRTIGLEKGFYSNLQKNGRGDIIANFSGGLLIMNPIDFGYEILGESDGIKSAAIVSQDNRVFFTESGNNIVSFHIDSLKKNTIIPPVKITGLRYRRMENVQERLYELKGLPQTRAVKLSYLDDLITIDFAALSFLKADQNQFKYRLLPSNANWITLGNQSTVNFMNLPPRKYTFEVMGANGDGVWNPEPTSLEIMITPPWWASSLARLMYLLGFFSTLIFFIRLRLRSLITRQKMLEESVAERTHELAIAKQEAEQASEAKSIFLSTVSHELRTPLTSIIGFTKLNKKSLSEKIRPAIDSHNFRAIKAVDQLDHNLDIVTTEGERLTTLINDLLDLAKIEAGKVEWKMEEVRPEEIIEQAVSSTAILFKEKKLPLHKKIDDNLSNIKADKDRIIQVIINLLSNAVKFTDEGGVFLKASQKNGNLLVSIEDTGKGIAFEDLPKVFEKFKQVGDNITDKPQGTGLGLPICKEIIDYHKGEIWVESEEGKGSTFSFLIPHL